MSGMLRMSVTILMVGVPLCTFTLLLGFPDLLRMVPMWFWIGWLWLSLIGALEAPALAERLNPRSHGVHTSMRLARRYVGMSLLNLASTLAALVYLMFNRPLA